MFKRLSSESKRAEQELLSSRQIASKLIQREKLSRQTVVRTVETEGRGGNKQEEKCDPESDGVQRQAQRGDSPSAQLCVLAGCEKPLSSCQHRKPTGRHCRGLRGRDGD